MRLRCWTVLILCACGLAAQPPDTARLAKSVTIQRDRYGVPHVFGPTDASVAFGMMYAQAEDNFWQIEDDYIRKLGRSSEIRGPQGLMGDLMVRLFESARKAQEEYAHAGKLKKSICDAWAAGLNYYLEKHPEVKPRLITHFEPWYLITEGAGNVAGIQQQWIRAQYPELGIPSRDDPPPPSSDEEGSNMWALSPTRSASGKALLFLNPHVGFFGGGQRYEAVLQSKEGLHVAGFAILGTPYIRSGFNEHLGWSHTNNYARSVDLYYETFDDPAKPLAYRYGSGYRTATEWPEEIKVLTPAGMETRKVRLRKTHHGPILVVREGHPIVVRAARFERDDDMEQRWLMARSRSLEEFRAVMSRRTIFGSNTIYADRKGNIFYLHGNSVPKRNIKFNWNQPVNGADPETEWQGFHEISELPQGLNPPAGFLQNCNSTPYKMTTDSGPNAGAPDATKFPAYMAPEPQTPRAEMSLKILTERPRFTFEEWTAAGMDRRVFRAEATIPALVDEWERAKPEKTAAAVAELKKWDRVSDADSVAMTLFARWQREIPANSTSPTLPALEKAIATLERDFGTWRVPWGEINRLQRVHTSGTEEPFSDARPSLPVRGGPPSQGIIFAFNTRAAEGQKRGYGISGNTYVAVVEFRKKPRARSILVFGESADPKSPHHFDQGEMYSRGEFKPVWFDRRELKQNVEKSYHP